MVRGRTLRAYGVLAAPNFGSMTLLLAILASWNIPLEKTTLTRCRLQSDIGTACRDTTEEGVLERSTVD